jgi:hypothetical protein
LAGIIWYASCEAEATLEHLLYICSAIKEGAVKDIRVINKKIPKKQKAKKKKSLELSNVVFRQDGFLENSIKHSPIEGKSR